jgi:meso-butanediol dehydrogenase / (S,S)-butanediol dehydrogenase / diacetyl reductase
MTVGRLDGKVVLISGTGGGMGRAAAIEFAGQGAKVAGCDLNAEADAETEALVRNAGGLMKSFAPVDLTDEQQARGWVDAAAAEFGGVDVLYNNASVARVGPWDELDYAEWRRSMTYELDLVYLCSKAAWPHLVARGGGCVLNVGSVSAVRGAGFVHQHAHGAAKGGVVAFTKHLMVSGIPHKIRAVSISPGMIRTPATSKIPEDVLAELMSNTPSRRAGQPEEVARLASFLASDEAPYINGADIAIDGGATAIAP